MVFAYLTGITLDIITGTIFWTSKQAYNGIYYLMYGSGEEEVSIDKKTIELLVKDNDKQREEISQLSSNIDILTQYIKDKEKN